MDFTQAFLDALDSNTAITRTVSLQDYLPRPLPIDHIKGKSLPYIAAYGDLVTTYPYYYEISQFPYYCLIYTEKGNGSLTIEDQIYTLSPHTLAIIDCNKKHRIEIKQSSWNYFVFFINGRMMQFLYELFTENGYIRELSPVSAIVTNLKEIYNQLNKSNRNSLIQSKMLLGILLELIIEKDMTDEIDQPISDYLLQIKQAFDTNYKNSFSLDTLEQTYGISKYQICREFTEQFNISPIQYLNYRRIEIAKDALLTTEKRINEIANMVGFDNINLFIRLFKKYTGVTPRNYKTISISTHIRGVINHQYRSLFDSQKDLPSIGCH